MSNRLPNALYLTLKGYNGESLFSEMNVKLVKKSEFVTYLVHKCLELHKN